MFPLIRASLIATVVTLAALTPAAVAQAAVLTYVLDDVWLLPDISHPGGAAAPMSGSFTWTYEEGDFENGAGEFVELDVPWFPDDIELAATIELTSIEITLPGKYHDLGVDVTMRLLDPLALDQSSPIDTIFSAFEIEQGITRKGHFISGAIVPVVDQCVADLDGDGVVAFTDLLSILATWGSCPGCPEDLDGSGDVGFADLLIMLSAWGACP
ncbi:MAG: hypothetical protein HKN62_11065 [Phycisphaerales bacterium]|nr:hypothetical protein [Phycisphaerales bacterium]